MRRRRLPNRRGVTETSLVRREHTTDFRHLEQVVQIQFPIQAARTYLQRHLGNNIRYHLVEARRGEAVGMVRSVEIRHANGGERTMIQAQRVLANGEPASFFVPDHLVRLKAKVDGAGMESRALSLEDDIILHVPVRGYLRFLPAVFQGDGPVTSGDLVRSRDTALQRWGSGLPSQQFDETHVDEDPLRRFLFIYQHVMTTVSDRIERIVDLTDPLLCEAKFLPWLASWVGFELDESLPVHQQRELVRRAIRLYRTRGTRTGVEDMVRVLTSAPVRVRERQKPNVAVLGKCVLIGGRDVVERYQRGEPAGAHLLEPTSRLPTSFFVLVLEPRERFRARFGERAAGVLRRISKVVSQERPIHVAFTIQFDDRNLS